MKYHVVCIVFNRFNYFRISLATLKEAVRYRNDVRISIFDYSENGVPSTDLISEISSMCELHYFKRTNISISDSNIEALYETSKNFDSEYILCLDDDGVVHPLLFDGLDAMTSIPNFKIGTMFNTENHTFVRMFDDRFGAKNIVGGLGMVLKKDYVSEVINLDNKSSYQNGGWDWRVGAVVASKGDFYVCPKRSYIEHIGYTGTNVTSEANRGRPDSIDRAYNFFN